MATCLNMWASPQPVIVILYLECTFTSSLCTLAYRFIFWPACPLFLPAVYVLEEKAESGYFSGISRNQAAPGRWLVVHEQIDWVCRGIRGIPGNGNVSEAGRPDQNTCLDCSRQPSLAWRLHNSSVHSQQIWSSWGMSDIWHMCCINRNLTLGFLEHKSGSPTRICSRYFSGW